jgi:hypothetical protein
MRACRRNDTPSPQIISVIVMSHASNPMGYGKK